MTTERYILIARPLGVGPIVWPKRHIDAELSSADGSSTVRAVEFRWAAVTPSGWTQVTAAGWQRGDYDDIAIGVADYAERLENFLAIYDEEPWEFEFQLLLLPQPQGEDNG